MYIIFFHLSSLSLQEALGEIVYVELPEIGLEVEQNGKNWNYLLGFQVPLLISVPIPVVPIQIISSCFSLGVSVQYR